MEYTNELLEGLDKKKREYNSKFCNWYHQMFKDEGGKINVYTDEFGKKRISPSEDCIPRYFNRGEKINNCLNLWLWDKYERNKILDLVRVNRCMNSRFCPNCKMMNVAKFIHEFRKILPKYEGYYPYMLTLTVPSCEISEDGNVLKNHIEKLNETFRKLNHKYNRPLLTSTGKFSSLALKDRYFKFDGGIKVLEITYDFFNGFHPHFHCLILVHESIEEELLEKRYRGKFSTKRQAYTYKSDIDLQIGKAWSMLWYGLNFRFFDDYEYNPEEKYLKLNDEVTEFMNLEVDFRELDDGGIYEVIKYTFKDGDVVNYDVFKNLVFALENKRIRQGFGCLYNVKCDEDEFDTGELQELDLAVDPEELPVQLLTKEIKELVTEFKDFKKVSRFEPKNVEDIKNSITD